MLSKYFAAHHLAQKQALMAGIPGTQCSNNHPQRVGPSRDSESRETSVDFRTTDSRSDSRSVPAAQGLPQSNSANVRTELS